MIAIAAAAQDGAIGVRGNLPWNLPSDLKHFRELTTGHTVIMGRSTFVSLPHGALPNRRNVVLTRISDFSAEGAEIVHSTDELFLLTLPEPTFVIGGEKVYRLLLPFCDCILLTRVEGKYPEADAYFPSLKYWKLTERSAVFEENGIRFRYETYHKT